MAIACHFTKICGKNITDGEFLELYFREPM